LLIKLLDANQFTSKASGKITVAPEGFPAFVPDPAPRKLNLTDRAIGLLDEASNRLGVLSGIGQRLPNPQLLITPYLRKEAVLSSRIEGTQTTMSDVFAAEADQLELVRAPDVQEVRNYVTAHEYGLSRLASLPLSLRLIRELHERLMTGVRGREKHPGSFRRYQNWIGATRGEDASYVGPPVPEMQERLDDLELFVHDREALRPLVQAAVLHYQFEAIHPFGDGNGRVGRLLIPLFLAERGLLPQPLLYLSAYFERSRGDYYDRLMAVSTHGQWDEWLKYFLAGVSSQAQEAAELADQLLGLQARYRDEFQKQRRVSAHVLGLIDALFLNPYVDTKRVQAVCNVSQPTARNVILTLEKHGILREITGRSWGTVYVAREIYETARGHD
jgi:Fic family protein